VRIHRNVLGGRDDRNHQLAVFLKLDRTAHQALSESAWSFFRWGLLDTSYPQRGIRPWGLCPADNCDTDHSPKYGTNQSARYNGNSSDDE
jgi:hypothetical protein